MEMSLVIVSNSDDKPINQQTDDVIKGSREEASKEQKHAQLKSAIQH